MNAYRISIKIADERLNEVSLVQPVGKPVIEEHEFGLMPRRKEKRVGGNKMMLAERLKGKS